MPPDTSCLLCGLQLESHDHLFFACPYSTQLWHRVSMKGDFSTPAIPWRQHIQWLSAHWKGKSLQLRIKLLCLSLSIYHIWRERNRRFHTQTTTSVPNLFSLVVEDIRLKLSSYRGIQDTLQHQTIQMGWRLPEYIFSVL